MYRIKNKTNGNSRPEKYLKIFFKEPLDFWTPDWRQLEKQFMDLKTDQQYCPICRREEKRIKRTAVLNSGTISCGKMHLQLEFQRRGGGT